MSLPLQSTLTEDMRENSQGVEPVLNVPRTDGNDLAAVFERIHLSCQENNTFSEDRSDRIRNKEQTKVYKPALKSCNAKRSQRRKEMVADDYLCAPPRHRPY